MQVLWLSRAGERGLRKLASPGPVLLRGIQPIPEAGGVVEAQHFGPPLPQGPVLCRLLPEALNKNSTAPLPSGTCDASFFPSERALKIALKLSIWLACNQALDNLDLCTCSAYNKDTKSAFFYEVFILAFQCI